MTTQYFLKKKIFIDDIEELQPDYEAGTMVLTHSQAVIDECILRNICVAGIEEGDARLECGQIIRDIQELEEEDFERVYRRLAGIPWDIAYTKRCLIREYGRGDLDALFELYAQPHMTDFMEPLFAYDEEKAYEHNYIEYIYKLYGFGMWLIFDRCTGKLIGRAGIEVRESCDIPNQAELGFAIAYDRQRQGIALEVCSKIIDLAADEYGLTSLIARCDANNAASIGLLTRLGFSHVGFEADGDMRFFMEI